MSHIFGFPVKLLLASVAFSAIILFSGFSVLNVIKSKYEEPVVPLEKQVPPEERVAIIELIKMPDGMYFKTSWNTKYFDGRCDVYKYILIDYWRNCMDTTTVDPRTKKL